MLSVSIDLSVAVVMLSRELTFAFPSIRAVFLDVKGKKNELIQFLLEQDGLSCGTVPGNHPILSFLTQVLIFLGLPNAMKLALQRAVCAISHRILLCMACQ